jgi:hypothetical protein
LLSRGLLGLVVLGVAPAAPALPADSGVVGWVEDASGAPVAGALVSLFGKGLRGGGFVTLSDSTGRFMLPGLPAGSYTLRALGPDRATTRQITVLPNRDSIFTLSFAAAAAKPDEDAAVEGGSTNERELKWLLRHKRRSVLEEKAVDDETARVAQSLRSSGTLLEGLVPWIPDLGGAVELVGSPTAFSSSSYARGSDVTTSSLGALKLNGRLLDSGHWSLGGMVADNEQTSWRMAAEFLMEPVEGHHVQAGAGYGTRTLQSGFAATGGGQLDNRTVGAAFVQDRWQASEAFAVTSSLRYSYIGFVTDKDAFSPGLSAEWKAGAHTLLRASSSARAVAPGGDLLTLSTLQTTPAMAIALVGEDVQSERLLRHELTLDRHFGRGALAAFVLRESARDRLLNEIRTSASGGTDLLRIVNGRGLIVTGAGANLSHQIGEVFKGSVTYTFGRSTPGQGAPELGLAARRADVGLATADASFHDLVARVETLLDWTDTRLVAYYRVNACHTADADARAMAPGISQRFDVQLTQGLPFLRSMTRAEWEVLVAFRNMFYEASEAGFLDEIAVVNPPKRVLGGIAVRF